MRYDLGISDEVLEAAERAETISMMSDGECLAEVFAVAKEAGLEDEVLERAKRIAKFLTIGAIAVSSER